MKNRNLFQEIRKVWFDFLTDPVHGKYGRKNVTIAVALFMIVTMGLGDLIFDVEFSSYIFNGFLTLVMVGLGLTVTNKMKIFKDKEKENEPEH